MTSRAIFPRRIVPLLLMSVVVLAFAQPVGALTAPAQGTANAKDTLVAVSFGPQRIAVGDDRAVSSALQTRSADASIDLLSAGARSVAGVSRHASSRSDSGSDRLGAGVRSIAGLGSVAVTGGVVDASVSRTTVLSSAALRLASIDAIGGLVTLSNASTATTASITQDQSQVTRTVGLGSLHLLSVRQLLNLLFIDPTALTCQSIEATGALLAVDTAQTCSTMTQVSTAIDAAITKLNAMSATMNADLATANATVAGVTLITQPVVDLAATYGVDLGVLGLTLPALRRDALIAEISRRAGLVATASSAAAGRTCTSVLAGLGQLESSLPSVKGAIMPLASAIDGACSTLRSLIDRLLDTALVNLDGLQAEMTARAVPGSPFARETGSVGSISVGNKNLSLGSLTVGGVDLPSAVGTTRVAMGAALNSLGIGAFPLPDLEILKATHSVGHDADGWFASSKITGVHLALPAVQIVLPSAATSVGHVLAARPRKGSFRPAVALTAVPAMAFDAAVMSGSARFRPASAPPGSTGSRGGTTLPVTGVSNGMMWFGALALAAAFGLRRLLINAR